MSKKDCRGAGSVAGKVPEKCEKERRGVQFAGTFTAAKTKKGGSFRNVQQ